VAALFGGIGWVVGGGWAAGVGTVAAVAGLVLARQARPAAGVLAVAAAFYGASAIPDGGWIGTLTGAAVLGGVMGEMLLGHWYLIDPALPRWALKRLAVFGGLGMAADAVLILARGGLSWEEDVMGWAFVVLAGTTLVLMTAVWFALNEPSYPGVMAATGLSYLAILTAIGAVVSGRALIDEGSSLLSSADLLAGTIALL
jgi:hypothetical protein